LIKINGKNDRFWTIIEGGDIAGDLACDMQNPFSERDLAGDFEKGIRHKKRDSAENISGRLLFGGRMRA
jgi:hypothetical protein